MAQKRPFDDEVVSEVSSKHPRQDRTTVEIISHDDSVHTEDGSNKPYDSGQASFQTSEIVTGEEHVHGFSPEISRECFDTEMPQSASRSHWATSGTSDENEPLELVHVPFSPGCFSFDRPVRPVINPDDLNYCLLDYPPRKQVPIGPEYQAEIPKLDEEVECTWEGLAASEPSTSTSTSPSNAAVIILSSDNEPSACNGERVGDGRIDCSCRDQGFIRCVRQHIAEARNKLFSTLGQDTFLELGFYDMGEVVAEKWGEEEEHLFHEVVYSNPASLGKNFWNALSAVFPSRTQMDIVSYYFNVFMLRKRATQNRVDPFNIDSDNDEWQGSDEDDDSGVESPVRHNGIHGHEHELEGGDNGCLSDESRESDEDDGLSCARKSNPDSTSEMPSKQSLDDGGENDANDGSCTSSDSGATEQGVAEMKPESALEWHGYLLESADAKAWDVYNNMSCPKSDVDFLPTCSMIEEVFGDADFGKRW